MLPEPSTAIKIGPCVSIDRILVTVGEEIFVQKPLQKQIFPFFSDGEICQLIRQDSLDPFDPDRFNPSSDGRRVGYPGSLY